MQSFSKRTHFKELKHALNSLLLAVFPCSYRTESPEAWERRCVAEDSSWGWSCLPSPKKKNSPENSGPSIIIKLLTQRWHWQGQSWGNPVCNFPVEHRGCRGNPGGSFLFVGIVYWMQIISNLLPLPFFFTTPRNWKKPCVNQCILPFTLPANPCLAWYKMLLLLQSGMRGLAITDGKLMLIILKRNLHFSDFPFLFQPTSSGKKVTESNPVCWFFFSHPLGLYVGGAGKWPGSLF